MAVTTTRVTAHEPAGLVKKSYPVLSVPELKIPKTTTVFAQDTPQKTMNLYSKFPAVEIIPLSMLVKKSATHDPIQASMKALSLLTAKEITPYPLARRTIAHDPIQGNMKAFNLVASVGDVIPETHKMLTHNPIQRVMEALAVLANRDQIPDPLATRRVIAHNPVVLEMQALNVVARRDSAPDPLLHKAVAFEIAQKLMQPYTAIAATDPVPVVLYPLTVKGTVAYSPTDPVKYPYSILETPDFVPDPLMRKASAIELLQKEMQPFFEVVTPDTSTAGRIQTTRVVAQDTVQKIMQVYSLLTSLDRTPQLYRVVAHDPVQKVSTSENILISEDFVPFPLVTRREAIEPIHKVMQAYTKLVVSDPILAPLFVRKLSAHDPIQKTPQPYANLAYADVIVSLLDPLLARRIQAQDLREPRGIGPYSVSGYRDLLPSPLLNYIRAIDIAQKQMQVYSNLPLSLIQPEITRISAHDPIQQSMLAMSILASIDYAPSPLISIPYLAYEPIQKQMRPYTNLAYADIIVSASLDPLLSRRIEAVATVRLKDKESYSILHSPDLSPSPLLNYAKAIELAQKEMEVYSAVATATVSVVTLYPLLVPRVRAHEPIQAKLEPLTIFGAEEAQIPKITQVIAHDILQIATNTLSVFVARDVPPVPLLRKISAVDLVQAEMKVISKLIIADRIVPETHHITAHETIQLAMEALSVLISRDRISDPLLTRKIIAHDPIQDTMETLATLGSFDRVPDPLLARRYIAHDPIQNAMEVLNILASRDITPDPLHIRRTVAHDPTQLDMETLAVLASRDVFVESHKVVAHDPLQLIMEAISILAATPTADPLLSRRILAHDPLQLAMEVFNVLISKDFAPDPLATRRIIAFDITQKQMQAISYLSYMDRLPDPLQVRRIAAHEPKPDLMETFTILGNREGIPYPLQLRTLAHDPLHKIMQPIPLLIRPDRAPDPLLARYIRAHDPLQLSMETSTLLVTADKGVPQTYKVTAFDPTQKIMQPFWLIGIRENTPYPLLTRLITAHEPTQKFLLSRFLVGYGFPSSDVIHKFSGHLIGRMWSAYFGRGWEGREEKAWEALEGKAWEGRHFRGWKR